MSTTARTSVSLTPSDILGSLLRADAADILGRLLPRVEPMLPALVAEGLGTMTVTEAVRALVADREHGGHAAARAALDAAGVSPQLLDRLDDVTFDELDHAFALGLACGLRMGR